MTFPTIYWPAVLAVSYLLGCLNGAVITSHLFIRDDVRRHGSGNAGLTNFYRTYGAHYALCVIACDMLKTLAAALLGSWLFRMGGGDGMTGMLLAGIGCTLGHMFPIFFGFKGGKGILCGGTLLWLLDWRIGLVGWALFALIWLTTRYVSLGSICATVSAPITMLFVYDEPLRYEPLLLIIVALVLWCHRENIRRLLSGTENKFHWHSGPVKEKGDPNHET